LGRRLRQFLLQHPLNLRITLLGEPEPRLVIGGIQSHQVQPQILKGPGGMAGGALQLVQMTRDTMVQRPGLRTFTGQDRNFMPFAINLGYQQELAFFFPGVRQQMTF
jgi:hypothetical protein